MLLLGDRELFDHLDHLDHWGFGKVDLPKVSTTWYLVFLDI